ncbi:LytR family transcriptional regulator, partial [Virgibacillus sp. 7505]
MPRDTKVQIAGRSMADKLNHAHAYGGPDLMVQTVEELLHIPIDHYIAVDMDGFVDVINTLG